jgi:hypothetical protein
MSSKFSAARSVRRVSGETDAGGRGRVLPAHQIMSVSLEFGESSSILL